MLKRRTLLATGLAASATRARAQSDPRPVLRVAVQALPPNLHPIENISNVSLRFTDNIFDSLLRRDFAAEREAGGTVLRPHLATEFVQRDPLTWIATLRPGVIMHDDHEMTADDVAATFEAERLWGPKAPFEGRISWGHLDRVEADGRDRVVFRTKSPDVVMPQRLAAYSGWIASKPALQASGEDGLRTKPIGSGPYRAASFQRDQRVVLDSHDAYFQGRPAARQVIVTAVPEASARMAGLRAGDFDLVTNLLPDQMQDLAGDRRFEAVAVPMDLIHVLFFDTRQAALRDPRVRQALVHAVDTELLARTLWGEGAHRMAAMQVPSFGDLYDRDRKGLEYDLDRARRLLAEAGWKAPEIVIRIAPGYYVNMLSAVQIVQEMWRAVGVPSRLETRENAATVNQPGADVRPTSISFRFGDPLGGGLMVHMSRQYSLQSNGFWQPEKFNAISDAFSAATEPAERKRLWLALMDEYEAQAPALILYPIQEVFAKRRDIRFSHDPLYYMDLRPKNFGIS
jgi:peptide/nickel transport system substrate-binding protein